MKKTVLSALAIMIFGLSLGVQAAEPTRYVCKSSDGHIQVRYETTSIIGKPRMDVILDGKDQVFLGEEITRTNFEQAFLVIVFLDDNVGFTLGLERIDAPLGQEVKLVGFASKAGNGLEPSISQLNCAGTVVHF